MPNDNKEQKDKILRLVTEAIQHDGELREKYQVGDKFRFIRDRLNALKQRVEEALNAIQQEIEKKTDQLGEDEVLVYVYIFNAQGIIFQTWQKMLSPSVFYEYSVNRPIYADKSCVESFIRSRPNKAQHGFLTVAIKQSNILPTPAGVEQSKDQLGNPLIKIREGSLDFKRMFSFTYQGSEYRVNESGQVIKKV